MAALKLDAGEQKQGSWTIMYKGPDGKTYNGKLIVTNSRLLYDAKFSMSFTGVALEYLKVFGSYKVIVLPKSDITNIETKKSFFKKKVILTMKDGSIHTFDYGMLPIDKVVAAIQA